MNALSKFWDQYGQRALAVVGGALAAAVAALPPETVLMLLKSKAAWAAPAAIAMLGYLKGQMNANKAKREAQAAQPEPPATDVQAHWLATVCAVLLAACVFGVALPGCKTTPTPTQAVVLDSTVSAAVAIALQRETADPAVWAKRARILLDVVTAVRPLADDEAVSLPALTAAVFPVLDRANLKPSERIAANSLVSALALVIDANTPPDSPVAVTVRSVLDSAARAAAVYVKLDSPESGPGPAF